jgi:hypothetical protein
MIDELPCEWKGCQWWARVKIGERLYCHEHASMVNHNRQLAASGYFGWWVSKAGAPCSQ